MMTTISKWGNSQGIRLPKIFLESLNLHDNDTVEISTENDAIIIKKSKVGEYKTIQELFKGYTEIYQPIEIEWGEPVGEETW